MKKLLAVTIILTLALTGCTSSNNIDSNKAALPSTNQQAEQQGNEADVKNLFEKGYYDYQGRISDSMKLQMSFYPLDGELVGSYFYEDQRTEMPIKGKVKGSNIELFQYDEKGKETGSFVGTMKTVDKIEGMWTRPGGNSYPFELYLKSILPGAEYGKRYAVAVGEVSDQAVEDFAREIQGFIKGDNKQELSEKIAYPIKVKIEGKTVEIQNKEEFVKNYEKIFNPDYKKAMSNAFTRYLYANWQGVMFGEGYNMWINATTLGSDSSSLRIIAINN